MDPAVEELVPPSFSVVPFDGLVGPRRPGKAAMLRDAAGIVAVDRRSIRPRP
jgi:hypothetical protein